MKHADVISLLSRLADSGDLPHAILLTGTDFDQKKEAALKFSKYLLSSEKNSEGREGDGFLEFYYNKECDCALCIHADGGSHPDFLYLDHSPVQIGDIRLLRNRFSASPLLSNRKIALIAHAESMKSEAANSLLKTLEEPRGNALFFLIAPFRSRILPTIASRAFEIRFSEKMAALSGRYGDDALASYLKTIRVFESGLLEEKFALAKKYNLENKSELADIIDIWLARMRDRILENYNKKDVDFVKRIFKIKNILAATNAAPQLLLEELLLNYA